MLLNSIPRLAFEIQLSSNENYIEWMVKFEFHINKKYFYKNVKNIA